MCKAARIKPGQFEDIGMERYSHTSHETFCLGMTPLLVPSLHIYVHVDIYIYIYLHVCIPSIIIYNMIIIYIYISLPLVLLYVHCELCFYMSSSHIHYLPLPMGFGWGLPGCTSRCRIVVCASADASLKLRRPRCLLGGLGASNLRRGLEVSPKWRMDDCRS